MTLQNLEKTAFPPKSFSRALKSSKFMPDHIQKFLRKIPERQRKQIEYLIEKIMSRETAGLDIQKLKGIKDVYRLKKGDMRIIYRIFNDEIMIIAIERRSDTTYNKF